MLHSQNSNNMAQLRTIIAHPVGFRCVYKSVICGHVEAWKAASWRETFGQLAPPAVRAVRLWVSFEIQCKHSLDPQIKSKERNGGEFPKSTQNFNWWGGHQLLPQPRASIRGPVRQSGDLKTQDVVRNVFKCCAGGWWRHTWSTKAGRYSHRPGYSRALEAERMSPESRRWCGRTHEFPLPDSHTVN